MLTALLLISVQGVVFSAEDLTIGIYETTAEEAQSVLCQLEGEGVSAGHITFNLKPLPNADNALGFIEYNGLFLDHEKKYYAIIHTIEITKLFGDEKMGYTFEGQDASIGKGPVKGAVRGTFKNVQEFEINGYFTDTKVECIYYRLTPLKSASAKKIVKENPKFQF